MKSRKQKVESRNTAECGTGSSECGIGSGRSTRSNFWFLLFAFHFSAIACFGANSFVTNFAEIQVVDSTVDNLGTTYILGADAYNNTLIRKYSSTGGVLPWAGPTNAYLTISNLNP